MILKRENHCQRLSLDDSTCLGWVLKWLYNEKFLKRYWFKNLWEWGKQIRFEILIWNFFFAFFINSNFTSRVLPDLSKTNTGMYWLINQHSNTQHDDTQHHDKWQNSAQCKNKNVTNSITTIDTECHYAECRYAECHYAECRYAECHYAECHYAEYCYVECC
jgi:hypothetical protein